MKIQIYFTPSASWTALFTGKARLRCLLKKACWILFQSMVVRDKERLKIRFRNRTRCWNKSNWHNGRKHTPTLRLTLISLSPCFFNKTSTSRYAWVLSKNSMRKCANLDKINRRYVTVLGNKSSAINCSCFWERFCSREIGSFRRRSARKFVLGRLINWNSWKLQRRLNFMKPWNH